MNFNKIALALALCAVISTAIQASQENTSKDTTEFKAFKNAHKILVAIHEMTENPTISFKNPTCIITRQDGQCGLFCGFSRRSNSGGWIPLDKCPKLTPEGKYEFQ